MVAYFVFTLIILQPFQFSEKWIKNTNFQDTICQKHKYHKVINYKVKNRHFVEQNTSPFGKVTSCIPMTETLLARVIDDW